MYYLHYPSGGFGHYMLQMISICYDNVFCPQEQSVFSTEGNSHSYPLHYTTCYKKFSHTVDPKFNFGNKESICLIDSGINDDVHRHMPNTIRMVIDRQARSILYQTCRTKAEGIYDFFSGENYEIREKYSLLYHHADSDRTFYLRNFQPHPDCINIPISSLIFDMNDVLNTLVRHFGKYDNEKVRDLHPKFLKANQDYTLAARTARQMITCLQTGTDMSLEHVTSLHDQGYLNYTLERVYNINEIPPYDYKDWFKNTQEIRTCLRSILSQ